MRYIFKNTKSLTGGLIYVEFLKNRQKLQFRLTASLPHSLTTVASLEPKQKGAQPPFYTTTTNSSVGCAFWGSDK